MREIKFRAWSKTNNRYRLWDDLQWLHVQTVFNMCSKSLILEQYTGLKDCEGTDIYEGDLLQNPYSETCHYVVEWYQSDHGGGWKKSRKNSKTDLGAECETMKVIGNIHQNPELLPTPPARR